MLASILPSQNIVLFNKILFTDIYLNVKSNYKNQKKFEHTPFNLD